MQGFCVLCWLWASLLYIIFESQEGCSRVIMILRLFEANIYTIHTRYPRKNAAALSSLPLGAMSWSMTR